MPNKLMSSPRNSTKTVRRTQNTHTSTHIKTKDPASESCRIRPDYCDCHGLTSKVVRKLKGMITETIKKKFTCPIKTEGERREERSVFVIECVRLCVCGREGVSEIMTCVIDNRWPPSPLVSCFCSRVVF